MYCNCGWSGRVYVVLSEGKDCPDCGRSMEFSPVSSGKHSGFHRFTTDFITGEDIEVTSPGHRDKLLSERGLTLDRYTGSNLSARRRAHLENVSLKKAFLDSVSNGKE